MKKTISIKFKLLGIYIVSLLAALIITSALDYTKSHSILLDNNEKVV